MTSQRHDFCEQHLLTSGFRHLRSDRATRPLRRTPLLQPRTHDEAGRGITLEITLKTQEWWIARGAVRLHLQVVRGPQTSESTFKALVNFGQALGKTTVDCKVTTNPPLIVIYLHILSLCVAGHSRLHRQPSVGAVHDGSRANGRARRCFDA